MHRLPRALYPQDTSLREASLSHRGSQRLGRTRRPRSRETTRCCCLQTEIARSCAEAIRPSIARRSGDIPATLAHGTVILHGVAKALGAASLVIAAAALTLAVVALKTARTPDESPTYAEISAAAVEQFTQAGNRMTPSEVLRLLGQPTEVYRNNPRALCWRYTVPYEIRMCWGPKRRQAWIADNIPRNERPAPSG